MWRWRCGGGGEDQVVNGYDQIEKRKTRCAVPEGNVRNRQGHFRKSEV